jgi:hypothetical protein
MNLSRKRVVHRLKMMIICEIFEFKLLEGFVKREKVMVSHLWGKRHRKEHLSYPAVL